METVSISLAALGRTNALEINYQLAASNGVTEAEIVEALLQVAIYAGYPAALDALVQWQKFRPAGDEVQHPS